jgi:hypothetical protein
MLISSADAFNNAMNAPNSRWAKTIGRFANNPIDIAHTPKFKFEPAYRFFCIGSCFARNIEEALICREVEVLSKRMVSPREEHPARVTGVINKFTTASMLNEARWALSGGSSGVCSIVDGGEGWFDLQINPNAKPVTRERADERRRYLEREYFARMRGADVLVVTLGLIETWRDNENDLCQNMAPPFYLARRQPGRFTLSITNVEENVAALEGLRTVAQSANPNLKIIVTVSPVPAETTFSGQDIFVANTHSKSVLRAAAECFAQAHADVDYYPSFEMVMGSARSAAFGRDFLHVRDPLVRAVIGRFVDLYLPDLQSADPDFVEMLYLAANPDVEDAVRRGELISGFHHWRDAGQSEGRRLAPEVIPPSLYDLGVVDPT